MVCCYRAAPVSDSRGASTTAARLPNPEALTTPSVLHTAIATR